MLRILHSVSNMDRAGIETMLMNYYRHMDRDRIQFDFLCNKQKPGAYDDEIRAMGGRIFRTPGLNPLRYPEYLAYMKELFREHAEYAIVEAHNGPLGVYALHAAKVCGIPVRIFHAHGTRNAINLKRPLRDFCRHRLPANINVRFACGADAARFYYGRRAFERRQFEIVPNAIQLERFAYDEAIRSEMRRRHGLEGRHVVGHVGRFMGQKNHSFLLDVFAELRKLDPLALLAFVGDGELMEKAREKAARLGIADSVRFVGNVPNANEWYQAFDCFVLPSKWEGLPLVGVEAQAADLPCVFSGEITREVEVTDRVRYIDLSAGPQRWAEAVRDALRFGERRDTSRILAEHHFDIRVEARRLQTRYFELAGISNEDRNTDAPVRQ